MSIINEALKKAQESKEKGAVSQPREDTVRADASTAATKVFIKTKRPNTLIYLIICLIFISALPIFIRFSSSTLKAAKPPQALIPKTDNPINLDGLPKLKLNGIVYDEKAPYVIVNNRILTTGEIIEGATLIQINKDSVKFVFNGEEFEVRSEE